MGSVADSPKTDQVGARVVFRTSWSYRCLALGLLLGAAAVSTALLVSEGWRDEPLGVILGIEAFCLFYAALGFVGARHIGDTIEVDEAAITYTGPRGRQRSIRWAELTEVRLNSSREYCRLTGGTEGRAVTIRFLDVHMFQKSRWLFDILYWAWCTTRKEAFTELVLPRSFRPSRMSSAFALLLFPLVFMGFAACGAYTGEWLAAGGFLALAAAIGVGCALSVPLEVTVGTEGVRSRQALGRARFYPMNTIRAIELGYDCSTRIVLANGKRRVLRAPSAQGPLEFYATVLQAWQDARKGHGQESFANLRAAPNGTSPSPQPGTEKER